MLGKGHEARRHAEAELKEVCRAREEFCDYFNGNSYNTDPAKMQKYYDEARIIIAHGGPASFMAALERGKTPIVMPRLKKFDEHVNDHQDYFCRKVEEKYHSIVIVKDKEELKKAIQDQKRAKSESSKSSNADFNAQLQAYLGETK